VICGNDCLGQGATQSGRASGDKPGGHVIVSLLGVSDLFAVKGLRLPAVEHFRCLGYPRLAPWLAADRILVYARESLVSRQQQNPLV
jgi:hypothetical protein